MTYQLAKSFFKNYFSSTLHHVNSSGFCRNFAIKKYIHSIQVVQVGRKILNQDASLFSQGNNFADLALTALLFHDIGRFAQTRFMFDNKLETKKDGWLSHPYDHGVASGEIVATIPEYNDLHLILPLRHHGHLIEEFYADPDYQAATPQLQQELRKIIFLVRDADKLANFHIQKYEDNLHKDPFFLTSSEVVKHASVSPAVQQAFLNHVPINLKDVHSYADRLICTLCWIFDFNYDTTWKLFAQEQYHLVLIAELAQYNPDITLQKSIETEIAHILKKSFI